MERRGRRSSENAVHQNPGFYWETPVGQEGGQESTETPLVHSTSTQMSLFLMNIISEFTHRVPSESDGWRLPGDTEAGAVGGGEAGGAQGCGVTAAGRDGHWCCGLRAEVKRSELEQLPAITPEHNQRPD